MFLFDPPIAERSASAPGPGDDFWYQGISPPTQAGNIITADTAIRVTAVWSCVKILSESIGQLPLHLYRRVGAGKERVTDHPAAQLIRIPNAWQTRMEFVEHQQYHLATTGAGYAEIVPGRGRRAVLGELVPHMPQNVRVVRLKPSRRLEYVVRDPGGSGERTLPQEQMLHLRAGMMRDSVHSLSPIGELREAIGAARAASDYGSRFFRNDAQPRGYLKIPGKLKDEDAADEYRRRWYARQGGINQMGIAVLTQGLEYEPIGLSNQDAQFLETRQYNAKDIARIFRIPAHMINEMSGAIKANVEQMGLEFVTYTLMSWLARWEQRLAATLLGPLDQEEYFFEFLVDGLMRADIRSRYTAYRQGTGGAAWLTPNEVRGFDNLPPHPDGDALMQPLNMSLGPGPDGADREDVDDEEREQRADALAEQEIAEIAAAAEKGNPGRFLNWSRVFYDRVAGRVSLELGVPLDVARVYAERSYAQLLDAGDRAGIQSLLEQWHDTKAEQLKALL